MNLEEARDLLALVRALDRRDVDVTVVRLWRDILDPYTFAECAWALKEFSRVETVFLRPAHLTAIIHRKRHEYAATNPGRGIGHPDQWLEWEKALEVAAAANRDRRQGQLYAVEAMGRGERDVL